MRDSSGEVLSLLPLYLSGLGHLSSPPLAQGCPHPALHPGLSHSAAVSLLLKIFNIWFKMAGPSVRFLSPKFPWKLMEQA